MLETHIRTQSNIIKMLKSCKTSSVVKKKRYESGKEKIQYVECPIAFDIETTSYFRLNNKIYNQVELMSLSKPDQKQVDKHATMYVWQFAANYMCYVGRTWSEFIDLMNLITESLELNYNKRIIIYIHNLAYEFQFIRKYFDWSLVFSMDKRTPLYALTTSGIEFRCSSLLAGCKLSELNTEKFSKLVGDLSYETLRHSETELTEQEIDYCLADVLVLNEYIEKLIAQNEKTITHIPYTKTGYVRRTVRKRCYSKEYKSEYTKLMKSLKVSPYEFTLLRQAFQGGFTHSNPFHYDEVCENVSSIDFTSSYPTVMIADYYPMTAGVRVNPTTDEQFQRYLNNYCCMFTIAFENITAKVLFENIISESKCIDLGDDAKLINPIVSNGRLVSADMAVMTITELDFASICDFYTYENAYIVEDSFYIYARGKLPKPIVECILDFYEKKTTLKGVVEAIEEYGRNKADLNSIFGMMVMNPVRDKIEYENDWLSEHEYYERKFKKKEQELGRELTESERSDYKFKLELDDIIAGVENENDSMGRFLFYPWGVWITAHARRRLLKQVLEVGLCSVNDNSDYIYTDTDSIKFMNKNTIFDAHINLDQTPDWLVNKYENSEITDDELIIYNYSHKTMIDDYNKQIVQELENALLEYNIDVTRCKPMNRKGKECPLGIWDEEHDNMRFKTLGAKRYMSEYESGEIHTTIAGCGRESTAEFITKLAKDNNKDPFIFFTNKMSVPWQYTSKLIHLYVDDECTDTITDYQGNTAEVHELSYIVLSPAEYNLDADVYEEFIQTLFN